MRRALCGTTAISLLTGLQLLESVNCVDIQVRAIGSTSYQLAVSSTILVKLKGSLIFGCIE